MLNLSQLDGQLKFSSKKGKKINRSKFLIHLAAAAIVALALTVEVANATETTTAATGQYQIVDTNQSACYNSSTGATATCAATGYDADYSGNQPSYTVTDSGATVTDNVTGLIWTQSSDLNISGAVDYNDKKYQSEAVTYCDTLTTAGYSDWRLPDIKEAYSLILFSGKDASSSTGSDTSTLTPFIDSSFDWAFGDTTTTEGIAAGDRIIDGQYASTSIYVSTTMNGDATMFGVNYVDGRIKGYPTVLKKFYVRCVRGNTDYGVNNFTDNGDQTITDSATNLMWQQDDSSSTDWDDAISTCEAATTASHTDWRLPNAKELQSIVDYSRSPDTSSSAAINSVFNATSFTNEEGIADWGYYWASSTHAGNNGDGTNATYLSFGRALGYFMSSILDVHGAGSQRSNDKLNISTVGVDSINTGNGTFYYHGPQGDILRLDNKVRCVRDSTVSDSTLPTVVSFAVDSNASSTDDISVTLNLSATDDTGVTGYYVSEDSTTPTISTSGWVTVTSTTSYSADISFTLSTGQGTKTVYAWFKDAAGNISSVASDAITSTFIPTLSEWGILIFVLLLTLSGMVFIAKQEYFITR